jgi:hypothetical protein
MVTSVSSPRTPSCCNTFRALSSGEMTGSQETGRSETRRPRPDEGSPEMTTLKLTTRYARYLLTSLAIVAFGMTMN